MELNGKVAVVTGGGSGIGRALAVEMAGRGCAVAVVDVNGALAELTSKSAGRQCAAFEVDVADAEAMWALAEAVVERFGQVDVVVNNAGIARRPTPVSEADLSSPHPVMDQVRRLVDVNVLGVVHGTYAFLPRLLERPQAHIANVASEAALAAVWGETDYVMTKFAVRGFTEALQMELVGTSVGVTLVCPGGTRTSIMSNSPFVGDDIRDRLQAKFERTPGMMTPEKAATRIADAIVRNRSRALLHPSAHLMSGLGRLLPGSYPRLVGPAMRGFIKKATDLGV